MISASPRAFSTSPELTAMRAARISPRPEPMRKRVGRSCGRTTGHARTPIRRLVDARATNACLTGARARNSVAALMLGLLAPTDPAWVDAVERDLDALLRDHAHCELKAAQSALSMLGRFAGQMPELVEPLVALAHEETEHFRQVLARLEARGGALSAPACDEYVVRLRKAASDRQAPALLDRLLVSALIEARSCERFRLLSERLTDAGWRAFYRELMASEAGHYRLFASLAEARFGAEAVRARLRTLAEREASIASSLPLGPTVHG